MMFIFENSDVIEYDGRTTELSNATLHMTQEANSMEK